MKTDFPGILGWIEEVAGPVVAERLAAERGGTYIHIPKRVTPTCKLSLLIGFDAACLLSKEIGHGRTLIPQATMRGRKGRQALAARMLAEGHSVTEVALAADVHERTARRLKKKIAKKLPLFE